MQTERRVAANHQTKPTDLGCESANRLLSSADTIIFNNKLCNVLFQTYCSEMEITLKIHTKFTCESTELDNTLASVNLLF